MNTVEVLEKARNIIMTQGWRRGGGPTLGGPLCVEQALLVAMGRTNRWSSALSHTVNESDAGLALRDHLKYPVALAIWNDAICGSKEEVIALFDKAIATERRRSPHIVAGFIAEGEPKPVVHWAECVEPALTMTEVAAEFAKTEAPVEKNIWLKMKEFVS